MPEHRRVLERGHRHHHADGRRLHARVSFLLGRHRESARMAGCGGAGERRAHGRADEAQVRRADLRQSRRSAGRRGGVTTRRASARSSERNPETAVEALTPDFQGVLRDVETVVDSGIEVFAQNIETVRRLTHPVRDPRAGYEQTLRVLAHAKRHKPEVLTKSSLMLGLGETEAEIAETLDDLRAAGVDIVTLGQYLRPTLNHLPIERFVTPEEFDRYRRVGAGARLSRVRVGPAGAIELSRRAGAEPQQCGIG